MRWLAQNWIWIVLVGAMVWMHLGHGGMHGGHGGRDGAAEGERQGVGTHSRHSPAAVPRSRARSAGGGTGAEGGAGDEGHAARGHGHC